ncbi:hypothetical protein TRVA0_010S00452 [Trichomonascus vanleenenianus]|uniref:Tmh11p n=1 Tax=Trichomonascus vanleenenianus TaxID=2268995 RepID=UPI003ECB2A1F
MPLELNSDNDDPSYFLAGACTAGGITAFTVGHSLPSLVTSLIVGSLYATTGYLNSDPATVRYAAPAGLGASVLLAGGILPRALKTQKALPMALVVFGVVNSAYYGRKWYDREVVRYKYY